ncbi:DsbA family protein [Streptomyces coryli]
MSERNREGKRAARERLAAEREREKARQKTRRTMIALASVLGVIVVAGGIAFAVNKANSGDDDAKKAVVYPKGATGEDRLAIRAGKADAPSKLTVYEDFRCPACGQFEQGFSKTIGQLVDDGKLSADYHLVTLIDGNLGGKGSLNGANAAACAQDAGKFREYHDVLYANQPQETSDDFGDRSRLKELAKQVKGLSGDTFDECVDDGRYDGWVQKSQEAFGKSGHSSTPTVLLDGKNVWGQNSDLTPKKLTELVDKKAKDAKS